MRKFFEILSRKIQAFWEAVTAWLSSPRHDTGIGPDGRFPPVDVVRVAKKLNLEGEAKRNGKHEIPETGDTQFDGPQEQVVLEITEGVADSIARENTTFVELTRELQQTVVDESLESDLRAYPADFSSALQHWIATSVTEDLPSLRERVHAAQRTIREAQQRDGLSRPPIDVDRGLLVLRVVAAAAAQAGANALFFMGAHPQGFLGGLSQAVMFALTDIAIVVCLGSLARYWNARIGWQRIAGASAGVLVVIWCVGFNLFVAHYRMAMSAEKFLPDPAAFTPFLDAIQTFVSTPFGISEVEALGMCVVGVLLSGIAAYNGYRWDDPVPGYGALGRQLKEAREDFDKAAAPVLEELEALYTEWHDKLQRERDRIKDTVSEIRFRVETKTNLLENMRGYLGQRGRAANTLLQMYRTANRRVRTTKPPAYFEEPYSITSPDWLDDDLSVDKRHLREQVQRADRVRAVCVEMEGELDSLLNQKRAALTAEVEN